MVKRIFAAVVVLLLLSTLAVTAAAHSVPDRNAKGSITFHMDLDGEDLDGGYLNLYRVADIAEEDGNYSFALIDDFAESDLKLENLEDPILAEELLTYANEMELDVLFTNIKKGEAVFESLATGLYVVWQGAEDATEGYAAIQPFLISVPQYQNGSYVMDVEADPKVPLETVEPETTVPPTTEPDEKLPQSGQMNWPVPVLAVGGAVLLILGMVLRTCGRKERTNA